APPVLVSGGVAPDPFALSDGHFHVFASPEGDLLRPATAPFVHGRNLDHQRIRGWNPDQCLLGRRPDLEQAVAEGEVERYFAERWRHDPWQPRFVTRGDVDTLAEPQPRA